MHAALAQPPDLVPYGASELKAVARRYMVRALTASGALWILLFLAAMAVLPGIGPPPRLHRVATTIDFGHVVEPPPILDSPTHPSGSGAIRPVARGRLVPVETPPDVDVSTMPPVSDVTDVIDPSLGGPPGPPVVAGARVAPPPPVPDPVVEHPDVLPIESFVVKPEYPELAITAQVEGLVEVLALVGIDGRVRETRIAQSIPMLDEAAVTAVRRWRFHPALVQGRPVTAWVHVPVHFVLHGR